MRSYFRYYAKVLIEIILLKMKNRDVVLSFSESYNKVIIMLQTKFKLIFIVSVTAFRYTGTTRCQWSNRFHRQHWSSGKYWTTWQHWPSGYACYVSDKLQENLILILSIEYGVIVALYIFKTLKILSRNCNTIVGLYIFNELSLKLYFCLFTHKCIHSVELLCSIKIDVTIGLQMFKL